MKLFKLKLLLGVLITSLFISSCSSPDELVIRESELKKAISNRADSCELVWHLETYGWWAQLSLFSIEPIEPIEPSQATVMADKLKNYSLEVLDIIKSDPDIKAEFFSDFAFFQEKISAEDFSTGILREMGRIYFPDCGYFSEDKAIEVPQEQEPQSDPNNSEGEITQSEPTNPVQEKTPQVAPTERIITLPKFVGYSMAQVDEWKWQNQIKLIFSYNTAFNYQTFLSCQVQKRGIVLAQSYPPGTQLIDSYLTFVNLDINC